MKTSKRHLVIVAMTVAVLGLTAASASAMTPRILIAGDSWSHFIFFDNTFRTVLDARGYADFDALNIAMGGSLASQWGAEASTSRTRNYLEQHPTIDIVFATLGGNDLMYGQPESWFDNNGSPEEEDAFFAEVAENVARFAKAATEVRPNIRVVICGYDYMNAIKKFGNNCTTPPETAADMADQINEGVMRFERKVADRLKTMERVRFVNNYGLMQWAFGYPGTEIPTWLEPWTGECKHHPHWDPSGADAYRFGPYETPLPGQVETDYEPFAGGDPTFKKSPWQAMLYYTDQWNDLIASYGLDPVLLGIAGMGPIDDWIHLSASAHEVLIGHCMDVCMEGWVAEYPYPQVVSVERATTHPLLPGTTYNPCGLGEVTFRVTFNMPVNGVDTSDFQPIMGGGLTQAAILSVAQEQEKDGESYLVTVDAGTGTGTLGLAVLDDDTIIGGGAPLWATGHSSAFVSGSPYTMDPEAVLPVTSGLAVLALLLAGALAARKQ